MDNKSELKAMGKASVAPLDPAKAAVVSSPGHLTCKGRKGKGAADRSAETSRSDAPVKVKTAGPSPSRGVKSGNAGKPKPTAPRLADAGTGSDSPDGKAPAPAPALELALTPSTSPADGRSKPKSGGKLRKTMEAKPEGLVEGQRRQQVEEVGSTLPPPRHWGCTAARACVGEGNGGWTILQRRGQIIGLPLHSGSNLTMLFL